MLDIKKLGYGIANIFLYIILQEVLTYYLGKFNHIHNNLILNFYLLVAPIIAATAIILLNRKIFKGKLQNFKKNYSKYLKLALKYYLCGLLLMYMSNILLSLFTHGIPENEAANREILARLPIYSIISMIIIAPLCEETVFRGSFKNTSQNKTIYLLITSFLFGFVHVMVARDYINIIPYASL
ncbi:MAG: CPBP family intramembrane metalloprotease, partial [Bacilli bacterium]|nr:CPBP family intramembrane metalloprotease [Bacilli bacterium]